MIKIFFALILGITISIASDPILDSGAFSLLDFTPVDLDDDKEDRSDDDEATDSFSEEPEELPSTRFKRNPVVHAAKFHQTSGRYELVYNGLRRNFRIPTLTLLDILQLHDTDQTISILNTQFDLKWEIKPSDESTLENLWLTDIQIQDDDAASNIRLRSTYQSYPNLSRTNPCLSLTLTLEISLDEKITFQECLIHSYREWSQHLQMYRDNAVDIRSKLNESHLTKETETTQHLQNLDRQKDELIETINNLKKRIELLQRPLITLQRQTTQQQSS